MITHSETLSAIGPAVAAVQKAVDHVAKDSVNPHFGSSYADLNQFLHALRGPMADNGLLMTQAPGMENGHVVVDTLLLHLESGEWIRDRAASPMQKTDPQGVGSAITYLRRYSLAALFAIPQEDDDGNLASEKRHPNTGQAHQPAKANPATTETCPKCSGELYDNRAKKASGQFSAKSPDYSCKDKDGCGWALWLDSARKQLQEAVEKLETQGAVPVGSTKRIMSGVEDGDLASLRIAQDWVNSKTLVTTP